MSSILFNTEMLEDGSICKMSKCIDVLDIVVVGVVLLVDIVVLEAVVKSVASSVCTSKFN